MTDQEARLVQAGRDVQRAEVPELGERAAQARATVAARPAGLDQAGVLTEAPPELNDHLAALAGHPAAQAMLSDRWTFAVADLTRVASIQPTVFTDHARERVEGVDEGDLRSIAAVTLRLPAPAVLPAQFDQTKQAWLFSTANPNLRVVGNFGGEIQPGLVGFGFVVQVLPSFLQVAALRGRLILRDGYHRAFGLISSGITHAPVFTREFGSIEELALNPGMLPQDAYLGERPALLPDFLDDAVAIDVELPAAQKMIVIQALELTPLG